MINQHSEIFTPKFVRTIREQGSATPAEHKSSVEGIKIKKIQKNTRKNEGDALDSFLEGGSHFERSLPDLVGAKGVIFIRSFAIFIV